MSRQIEELRDQLAFAERGVEELRKKRELVARLEGLLDTCREELDAVQRDLHRWEGPGLAAFVSTLFTDRDSARDEQRRELAMAVLVHDGAHTELAEAREWLEELLPYPKQVEELRARLESKLRTIAVESASLDASDARVLWRLELQHALREMLEVDRVASDALSITSKLEAALTAPPRRGHPYRFGGPASLAANSRVLRGHPQLGSTQLRLRVLAQEVEGLRVALSENLALGSLTESFPLLLDNVFTDFTRMVVHSRSDQVAGQTRDQLRRIRSFQDELRGLIRGVESRLRELDTAGP